MLSFLINYIFLFFLATLAVSNNLILFFIGWVGLNVSLYGILLKGFNSYNIEITLKYFLSGAIVTSFLLLGIAFYYLEFFTFNTDVVSYIFFNNDSLLLAQNTNANISELQKIFFFILISVFLFKLGAFPFHFYLGDIYEALDFKKTMFLYTVPLKLVTLLTMLKFLINFWYLSYSSFDLIMCAGIGSIFVSSFTAISQIKLKKFWAYSYLNSVGFTLVAVASGLGSEFGELSFYSAKVYFLIYLLTWCGIFEIFTSFKSSKYRIFLDEFFYTTDLLFLKKQVWNVEKNQIHFSWYDFVGKNNKVVNNCQFAFLIFMLSFIGLPPTLGFFSKMLVYLDLVETKNTVLYLYLILLLTPVMGYAYLKLIIYVVYPIKGFNESYFFEKQNKVGFWKWIQSKKQRWVYTRNSENSQLFYLGFYHYALLILILPLLILFVLVVDTSKIIDATISNYFYYVNLVLESRVSIFAKSLVGYTDHCTLFYAEIRSEELLFSLDFLKKHAPRERGLISLNHYDPINCFAERDILIFIKKISNNLFNWKWFIRLSNFN